MGEKGFLSLMLLWDVPAQYGHARKLLSAELTWHLQSTVLRNGRVCLWILPSRRQAVLKSYPF